MAIIGLLKDGSHQPEIERGKEHVASDKVLRLLDVLNMTMVVHVEGK